MGEIELRVGDRFSSPSITWELIKLNPFSDHVYKVIECHYSIGYKVGDEVKLSDVWVGWKYLGNFSKSNQFKNFYERIC